MCHARVYRSLAWARACVIGIETYRGGTVFHRNLSLGYSEDDVVGPNVLSIYQLFHFSNTVVRGERHDSVVEGHRGKVLGDIRGRGGETQS